MVRFTSGQTGANEEPGQSSGRTENRVVGEKLGNRRGSGSADAGPAEVCGTREACKVEVGVPEWSVPSLPLTLATLLTRHSCLLSPAFCDLSPVSFFFGAPLLHTLKPLVALLQTTLFSPFLPNLRLLLFGPKHHLCSLCLLYATRDTYSHPQLGIASTTTPKPQSFVSFLSSTRGASSAIVTQLCLRDETTKHNHTSSSVTPAIQPATRPTILGDP